jgi:hypothetical protein
MTAEALGEFRVGERAEEAILLRRERAMLRSLSDFFCKNLVGLKLGGDAPRPS